MRRPRSLRSHLPLLVATVLAASLLACSPSPGRRVPAPDARAGSTDGPLVVVATFTVLADVVAVVGGEDVSVGSLTGPGMNVHGYEPTPEDLRQAAAADLVVANGLGLETWLDDLIDPLGVPVAVVGEAVTTLPIQGSAAERGRSVHNPHVWMSPRTGQEYVTAVADALSAADPAHEAAYRARATGLSAELAGLAAELDAAVAATPPERRVLVTCEGAFSYLALDAGLREVYLWPVNAERQGTPRQTARVIDAVREARVPVVFCEWTVPATAQQQVARETGARYGGDLYVDALSGPDGPVPGYLDLLRHDVAMIKDALAPEGER